MCVCVCRGEARILMQLKCGARGNSIWVWVYIQRYVNIKCTEWQLGSAAILSVGCPTRKISCSASLISCSKKREKTPDYSPNICFPSFQTPPATVMRCVEYLQAAVQRMKMGKQDVRLFIFTHSERETCTLYRGKHRKCKELKHVSLIIKTNNNICVLNCSLGSDFCCSWHTFSS